MNQLIAFVIVPIAAMIVLFALAMIVGKWLKSAKPYSEDWIIYKNENRY